MSDSIKISTKENSIVVGIVKYDYTVAGYPDVMKKAQELAKDENFLQIIVRKVSQENWGIGFIYSFKNVDEKTDIWNSIKPKFVDSFKSYAWDVSSFNNESAFVVNKAFEVIA